MAGRFPKYVCKIQDITPIRLLNGIEHINLNKFQHCVPIEFAHKYKLEDQLVVTRCAKPETTEQTSETGFFCNGYFPYFLINNNNQLNPLPNRERQRYNPYGLA
ncbi:hypothetical protein GcM1_043001 [Golovinomyces cichoracearum]|uniref:Uncharacterized protein n=1 Tax=Golovinomyces cichoracearum TaxID=62708 RepID=A0A420JCI9_9PEZI|nr:hypothetical protein GcM1_043001 [Golovinomyces cichoracearum]